jgi:hypothetical protein
MTPFGSTADIVLADCEIPHLADSVEKLFFSR